MSLTKPEDFPLLLEVFRDALKLGLLSKTEVVAWADNIISNEDEPDYFFIEVSLCGNLNGLIEVLNRYISSTQNAIPTRVIYALIHQKLIDNVSTMSAELAASLILRTPFREKLTPFERDSVYIFDDFDFLYPPHSNQLETDVLNFLFIYKDFNLNDYQQWPEINDKVIGILTEEQAKADIFYESFKKAEKKRKRKRRLKRYAIRSIPIMIGFAILITDYVCWNKSFSNTFFSNSSSLYFLNIFCGYSILRIYYWWWRNKRRMR